MTDKELQTLLRDALRGTAGRESSCPSLGDLAKFVENPASSSAESVRAHIADCHHCAAAVAHLALAQENFEKHRPAVRRSVTPLARGEATFHVSRLIGGLAAATVLILIALLAARAYLFPNAPRQELVVKDNNVRKTAPPIARNSDALTTDHRTTDHRTTDHRTNDSRSEVRGQRSVVIPKPRPQRTEPLIVKLSEVAKGFLAVSRSQVAHRSVEPTDEPPLAGVKPHLTIILSQTPELVAKTSPHIAGPFTFQVDEVEIVGRGFQGVKGKEDVAQTKDAPVATPSLALTKPLERGKIYEWRVSAGDARDKLPAKSQPAFFMVAEQSVVDAAKKYAHSPLRLAEFYKAHGLYLDAVEILGRWLSKHPADMKAQHLKAEVERFLPPTSP